jgi:hypothetical protein
MNHWQTASGALLCGQSAGPGDSIVDELTPADCPACLDVMMVARRACEIIFTESCNAWTMREVRDQLYAEFGTKVAARAEHALGALING